MWSGAFYGLLTSPTQPLQRTGGHEVGFATWHLAGPTAAELRRFNTSGAVTLNFVVR
jgi:hypothetical protein